MLCSGGTGDALRACGSVLVIFQNDVLLKSFIFRVLPYSFIPVYFHVLVLVVKLKK